MSFKFGLVADVQHADKDDGHTEGRVQRYRQAAACLEAAVQHWQQHAADLAFVLTLGDIIDGNVTPEHTEADLQRVAGSFDRLAATLDVQHVVGNHCLAVGRRTLLQRLRIGGSVAYRMLHIAPNWRLIILDTTEMSGHSGYPTDSPLGQEAQQYMSSHPMSDREPHMHPWNGGCGAEQMQWLRSELAAADAAGDRVLVAAHHQVGQGAARATHMAWNWRDIQSTLLSRKAFVAFFAGHDHVGGYADIDGRHFVTLEAMLEAPDGGNSYGIVEVDKIAIHIDGLGTAVTNRTLKLLEN